ncbi:MAG: hypothetical protein HQL27_06095 [Candidatus Omnitrophica bacterium]|nr:hypothetical protein [Candidatus Omnitrophota bacterium]
MKVVIILLIGILVVSSFVLAFSSNKKATGASEELNQERYLRMVAEEGLVSAKTKIGSLESEMERAKGKTQSLERLIEQKDIVLEDLKGRVNKAEKAKDELEKKVKELEAALSSNASAQPAGGQ